MDLVFTNGNDEQKALWRFGLHHLTNLPFDDIPLSETVTFKPPSDLKPENGTSTYYAETFWDYDSGEGDVWVRNDAPGFGSSDASLIAEATSMGLHYSPQLHLHETAVHETGHAVFAAIPHKYRLAICKLFGANTDDPSVIYPTGEQWTKRIGEAIAETFKEAFLPERYRVFPARTDKKLGYAYFPTFRRLIREGLEAVPGGGGEVIIPKTNVDIFTVDHVPHWPISGPVQGFPGPDGKTGLHRIRLLNSDYIFNERHGVLSEDGTHYEYDGPPELVTGNFVETFTESESTFHAWVEDGAQLVVEFTIPADAFTSFTPYKIEHNQSGEHASWFSFTTEPDLASALSGTGVGSTFGALYASWVHRVVQFAIWPYYDGDATNSHFRPDKNLFAGTWLYTAAPSDIYTYLFQPFVEYSFRNEGERPTRAGRKAWEEEHEAEYAVLPLPDGEQDGILAFDGGPVDRHVKKTITVNDDWTTTKKCRGKTYRLVKIEFSSPGWYPRSIGEGVVNPEHGEPGHSSPSDGEGMTAELEEMLDVGERSWLPQDVILVPACSEGGGESGRPIALPPPSIQGGGASSGARRHRRPISANSA